MNTFIYFEDLVANALIEKIKHHQGRSITLTELIDYGNKVKNWWDKYRNINVTILNSEYYIKALFNYSNYFSKYYDDNIGLIIYLKDEKTIDDLRQNFRSYLNADMLLCFIQSYEIKNNKGV